MINLLPPELKQEYRYARRNTALLRYLSAVGIGIFGMALITLAGVLYLRQVSRTYTAQVQGIEQSLQQQKQGEIEAKVAKISNDLRLAVRVLSEEVLFSKLLKQLAVTIPNNTSLSSLSISQAQKSVDITANTVDYGAATQLQINLTDPANQIFSKADITNITCNDGNATTAVSSKYPCAVTMRALFTKNNPFLFISNKAKQ